jgi:hypothetical protein
VSIAGLNNGFHLSVAADTGTHVLKLYVGVVNTTGSLTVTFNDSAAKPFVDSTLTNLNGTAVRVYTITYHDTDSEGTLNVDWVNATPTGSVTLAAATLFNNAVAAPDGAPTNLVATGGATTVGLTWQDNSTNESGFVIERSYDTGPTKVFTVVGGTAANVTSFTDSLAPIFPDSPIFYRVRAVNSLGTSAPSNVATAQTTAGTGLLGRYYANINNNFPTRDASLGIDTSVTPLLTRLDPTVDVDWGDDNTVGVFQGGSPAPGVVPGNQFSTQWDGFLKVLVTDDYTFYTDTDDFGRLFLDVNQNGGFDFDPTGVDTNTTTPNGEMVVNGWFDQGTGANESSAALGTIHLVAGQKYRIRMQQLEHGGGAGAHLRWSAPTATANAIQAIPTANLFAVPPDVSPPTITAGPEIDRKLPGTATYTPKQHIVIHFSEQITPVSSSAITVTLVGGGAFYGGPNDPNPNAIGWAFDAASNSGIITFPGIVDADPNFDQMLPNGNYTITLSANGVRDLAGNKLDSNGDGTGGDDYSFNFYVFRGDTQNTVKGVFNGDRSVSVVDFQRFELNFGATPAERPSQGEGDFNHDGFVDEKDFVIMNNAMGGILFDVPPGPSAPVGAPAPAPVPVTSKPVTPQVKKPAITPVKKPVVVAKPPAKVAKPVVSAAPKNAFGTKKIGGLKELLAG